MIKPISPKIFSLSEQGTQKSLQQRTKTDSDVADLQSVFELNNRSTGAWFFFQSRTFNCSTHIFLIWNWKWYCLCSPNGFNPIQIPVLHISNCWSVSGDFEFSTVGSVIYTVTLDWKWKKANICITSKANINIFEKNHFTMKYVGTSETDLLRNVKSAAPL